MLTNLMTIIRDHSVKRYKRFKSLSVLLLLVAFGVIILGVSCSKAAVQQVLLCGCEVWNLPLLCRRFSVASTVKPCGETGERLQVCTACHHSSSFLQRDGNGLQISQWIALTGTMTDHLPDGVRGQGGGE